MRCYFTPMAGHTYSVLRSELMIEVIEMRPSDKLSETPKRFTLYVSKKVASVLDSVERTEDDPGPSRGERIHAVCDRYMLMVRESVPTLTENEWMGIVWAFNGGEGVNGGQAEASAFLMSRKLADTNEYENSAAECGYDNDTLLKKIDAMPIATRLAVLEVTDRWWAKQNGDGATNRQRLIASGAKISE